MYELLEIPRNDKAARFAHLMENFNFFGAPAALYCMGFSHGAAFRTTANCASPLFRRNR